jgi:hypothetical protein
VSRQIELHVEKLVLDGFPAGYGQPVAVALERELTRLLGADGLASARRDSSRGAIDAGTVELGAAGAGHLGQQVANEVHRRLPA